jgi:hypothetical protein
VWLCELRLWLSVVIESEETRMSTVTPLPNLDCNVRVGDALSGAAFRGSPSLLGPPAILMRLRARYVRATGARKAPLRRALAREETRRVLAAIDRELCSVAAARRELLLARRSPDLFGQRPGASRSDAAERRTLREQAAALRGERRRLADGGALPFSFPSHFAHVHAAGGFGLIVGNPPWVRLHNIPSASRAALRAGYRVFRESGWEPATASEGMPGFTAQVDLAALFFERSLALARLAPAPADGGVVALLLPAKLWRSLSGGAVRRLVASDSTLHRVEDWTDAPSAFDAAVYPSVIIASPSTRTASVIPQEQSDDPVIPRERSERRDPVADTRTAARTVVVAVRRRSLDVEWEVDDGGLHFDRRDAASPWLLLPPDARAAFERLRRRGRPLGTSGLGRATLGVKCGCNDAFVVTTAGDEAGLVAVQHRGRKGTLEPSMLRPLLRGDALTPWRVPASGRAIVWTHAENGAPLSALPAAAARWLAPWRRRLRARSDLRGGGVWWMLFRTEAAGCRRTRVVWSDFGRAPRAAILAAGDPTVPLNSCYVMACNDPADALALAALLNTPLAAAWLNAIAEPARGGWHRYLAWTIALLPLPTDWTRARSILTPLAERALVGFPPGDEELLRAACHAYRLRREDVAPLVAWCR